MDYAALDFGTNSVKVLVVRETVPGGPLSFVAEPTCVTRLGEGVDRSRHLLPEAVTRTLTAVRGFFSDLHLGPGRGGSGIGIATATSAARDATNREFFLAACRDLLGAEPQLLSGDTEAETVFCGATGDQPAGGFCACIDIGGGSTEVVAGCPGTIAFRTSLDLGCVRLGERFALLDAARADDAMAARAAAAALLRPAAAGLCHTVPAGPPVKIIASGGTAITLAAMVRSMVVTHYAGLHGTTVPLPEVDAWAERLLPLSLARRQQIPYLPADRAAVVPAGLVILGEALRALKAGGVTISTHGLRWGLVRRLRCGEFAPTWHW